MANKVRGEVDVAGSNGNRYVFRMGSGAICQLEESLNLDVMSLFEQLQKGKVRLSTVREFVKASSVGKPEMSNEDANDIIDDCGVVPLLNAMTDSILLTFNVQTKESKKAASPQKPARAIRATGAGTSSESQKRVS